MKKCMCVPPLKLGSFSSGIGSDAMQEGNLFQSLVLVL